MALVPKDDEEREEYFTSLKKTAISTLFGLAAGVASFYLTWTGTGLKREPFALMVIMAAIWIQKPIYAAMGIDPEEFESKDWLFLGFMTFTMALVTWTLMIPINPLS